MNLTSFPALTLHKPVQHLDTQNCAPPWRQRVLLSPGASGDVLGPILGGMNPGAESPIISLRPQPIPLPKARCSSSSSLSQQVLCGFSLPLHSSSCSSARSCMGLHQGHHQCLSSRPWTSLPYPGSGYRQGPHRGWVAFTPYDFLPGREGPWPCIQFLFTLLCQSSFKGPLPRGWECLGGRVRCRWVESQAAPLRGEQSREEGKRTNQKTVTGAASPHSCSLNVFLLKRKRMRPHFQEQAGA